MPIYQPFVYNTIVRLFYVPGQNHVQRTALDLLLSIASHRLKGTAHLRETQSSLFHVAHDDGRLPIEVDPVAYLLLLSNLLS